MENKIQYIFTLNLLHVLTDPLLGPIFLQTLKQPVLDQQSFRKIATG